MGKAALFVFLASLGAGALCLALLVRSVFLVYRTLRSAYADFRVWAGVFARYAARWAEAGRSMEDRLNRIASAGGEMRGSVEEIQDALEEILSSPLLRAARLLGKRRRG